MKLYPFVLSTALLFTLSAAHAAGGGGGGGGGDSVKVDPVVERANAAIAKKDWPAAQTVLKTALDSNAQNADYHNLYAYSLRKGANPDMKTVFLHYEQALRIDPQHRGAHEYMGEAYLMVENLAKAKEHLAALDKLCFFPCEEFSDLKKAIAAYERSHAG
jgi:tetratricopeptide (TPR) repeat protein